MDRPLLGSDPIVLQNDWKRSSPVNRRDDRLFSMHHVLYSSIVRWPSRFLSYFWKIVLSSASITSSVSSCSGVNRDRSTRAASATLGLCATTLGRHREGPGAARGRSNDIASAAGGTAGMNARADAVSAASTASRWCQVMGPVGILLTLRRDGSRRLPQKSSGASSFPLLMAMPRVSWSALTARRRWLAVPRSMRSFSGDSDPVPLVMEGPRPDADLQRKEALRLYRDILRSARHFTWPDKDGVLWRDKLVASARKEFEDARHERDPDIIARLLIGGQDALIAITDRMLVKARQLVDEESAAAPRGLGDGWTGGQDDGATVGAVSGAIPYGSVKRAGARASGGAGERLGQKEGRKADELTWKRDWQHRHGTGTELKSPWSSRS